MRVNLLDLKSEMIRDGITMIDFLDNNFTVNFLSPELQIIKILLVEERHLCRLDLLSFDAYGSADYVDVIMKFNMITNPFSMEINDIIVFPSINSAQFFFKRTSNRNDQLILDTKSIFIDPTRASKKDVARLRQLEKIASRRKSGASEIKPTNLLRSGEAPFDTTGGALRLAPNISK